MTNATMYRKYSPNTSPLLGLAALVAAAVTFGTAVLLPSHAKPVAAPVVAVARQPVAVPVAVPVIEVVTLPAVEVVGTRPAKLAQGNRRNVPAVFKNKG